MGWIFLGGNSYFHSLLFHETHTYSYCDIRKVVEKISWKDRIIQNMNDSSKRTLTHYVRSIAFVTKTCWLITAAGAIFPSFFLFLKHLFRKSNDMKMGPNPTWTCSIIFMFFRYISRWLKTNYQTQNVSQCFFFAVTVWKEKTVWPLLFSLCDINKRLWLTFGKWLLVAGWWNERNIKSEKFWKLQISREYKFKCDFKTALA